MNDVKFEHPQLQQATENSDIPLLGRDVYGLIGGQLEKLRDARALTAYSQACTLFYSVTQQQRERLKAEMEEKNALVLTVTLLGDHGAGKTFLRHCFLKGKFSGTPDNSLMIQSSVIKFGHGPVRFKVWDECGRRETSARYRFVHGNVVVFDLTNNISFGNVKQWLQEIERYGIEGVPIILVGTKNDLVKERVVDFDTAQAYAEQFGIRYVETSALTGENITDVFKTLGQVIYERLVNTGQIVVKPLAAKPDNIPMPDERKCALS